MVVFPLDYIVGGGFIEHGFCLALYQKARFPFCLDNIEIFRVNLKGGDYDARAVLPAIRRVTN